MIRKLEITRLTNHPPSIYSATLKFQWQMLFLQRRVQQLIHVPKNLIATHGHKILYKMNNAYFRYNEEENQLAINFRYINPEFKIDRDFNFCRNPSENIDLCLERMRNNLEKEFSKKTKKKNNKKTSKNENEVDAAVPPQPEISVKLVKAGNALSNVTFLELFKDLGGVKEEVVLKVIDNDFQIAFNQPWVISVTLPSSILAGFEVYPNKMEIQFGSKKCSNGVWYRGQLVSRSNFYCLYTD